MNLQIVGQKRQLYQSFRRRLSAHCSTLRQTFERLYKREITGDLGCSARQWNVSPSRAVFLQLRRLGVNGRHHRSYYETT